MTNIIVRILRKVKRTLLPQKKTRFAAGGNEYYSPGKSKNAGFQGYYQDNKEEIRKGNVPERYTRIANVVPGEKILEIGSADGTQTLTLSQKKGSVVGVELMPMQYQEALELQQYWKDNGLQVENARFVNENIAEKLDLLNGYDTILMSRVLYHMREAVEPLFDSIAKSDVENVVLVGCPLREARWQEGGASGDSLGKYAYYASSDGMKEILEQAGFDIVHAEPSGDNVDPLVVGTRKKAA